MNCSLVLFFLKSFYFFSLLFLFLKPTAVFAHSYRAAVEVMADRIGEKPETFRSIVKKQIHLDLAYQKPSAAEGARSVHRSKVAQAHQRLSLTPKASEAFEVPDQDALNAMFYVMGADTVDGQKKRFRYAEGILRETNDQKPLPRRVRSLFERKLMSQGRILEAEILPFLDPKSRAALSQVNKKMFQFVYDTTSQTDGVRAIDAQAAAMQTSMRPRGTFVNPMLASRTATTSAGGLAGASGPIDGRAVMRTPINRRRLLKQIMSRKGIRDILNLSDPEELRRLSDGFTLVAGERNRALVRTGTKKRFNASRHYVDAKLRSLEVTQNMEEGVQRFLEDPMMFDVLPSAVTPEVKKAYQDLTEAAVKVMEQDDQFSSGLRAAREQQRYWKELSDRSASHADATKLAKRQEEKKVAQARANEGFPTRLAEIEAEEAYEAAYETNRNEFSASWAKRRKKKAVLKEYEAVVLQKDKIAARRKAREGDFDRLVEMEAKEAYDAVYAKNSDVSLALTARATKRLQVLEKYKAPVAERARAAQRIKFLVSQRQGLPHSKVELESLREQLKYLEKNGASVLERAKAAGELLPSELGLDRVLESKLYQLFSLRGERAYLEKYRGSIARRAELTRDIVSKASPASKAMEWSLLEGERAQLKYLKKHHAPLPLQAEVAGKLASSAQGIQAGSRTRVFDRGLEKRIRKAYLKQHGYRTSRSPAVAARRTTRHQ